MPQNPYRQVNGPDGPINFPAGMSDDQVTQAMQKLYPPKQAAPAVPEGHVSVAHPLWSEQALDDIRFGGTQTLVGKTLQAIGFPKTGIADSELGKFAMGPLYGPLEAAHGAATAARPGQTTSGLMEMMGGVFHGTGLAGGATSPEFLPVLARFSTIQAAGEKLGQHMGLSPEANTWFSMILATAGTGASLDPRRRVDAVEAEKRSLRASRGFGAQTDEAAIQRAAEENVQKAEAQANTIKNIAKQTGQDIAQVLQSGAASVTGVHHDDEQLKLKFGEEAKAAPPKKPAPTPESLESRIKTLRAQLEIAHEAELAKAKATSGPTPESRAISEAAFQKNFPPEGAKELSPVEKEHWQQSVFGEKPQEDIGAKVRQINPEPTRAEVQAARRETPVISPAVKDRIAGIRGAMEERRQTTLESLQAENDQLRTEQAERTKESLAPTRLETKQGEMRDRQEELVKVQELTARRRQAKDVEIERLRQENEALRAQGVRPTSRTEVGTVAQTAPIPKPETAPIQTSEPAKGPGEPVRPAEGPKVEVRHKADLVSKIRQWAPDTKAIDIVGSIARGEAKSSSDFDVLVHLPEGPIKTQGELNLTVDGRKVDVHFSKSDVNLSDSVHLQRQEKGLSVPTRRIWETQPRSLRGDLGERAAQAEAERTRPGSANPEAMQARMDAIASAPKATEMAEAPPPAKKLDFKKQMQIFHERVAAMQEKMPGVSKARIQEIVAEQMRKERGAWTMMPGKQAPKIPPTGTALDELTTKLESSMKAVPPDDSRMKFVEHLDKTITEGWDKVQLSLGRIAAHAVALKDMYMREPALTDYRTSVGRFSGALNRSAWELRQFSKAIKEKLPDVRRREAITNWIQAGGDDSILANRAARSKGYLRAGYEAARTLTEDEKGMAQMIMSHFDKRLKEAIQMDVLKDGLENYVPQIWKAKDQNAISSFFSSLHRGGLLKPDFNAAKHRIFDSYFEGEQTGRVPVNKDIGFLVASWDRAFNQAIASRAFIRDLTNGVAKDGRPIIAPSGAGKTIWYSNSPREGDQPEAYLIYPKAAPDETGDYRAINHPALTKWTWATKDAEGNPIFVKGDLRVHPDHAQTLDNVINRGKWAAAHPVQSAILKGQGFFKATLLSMSPFHQIQEGTHAIFHKVNPFSPPDIDLTNPSLGKLLDRGLVIGNFDPVAAFDEGLTSGSGGLVGKIPGLGRMQQKYSEYLFQDYIPRLKAKMATEAYERNMHRYQGAMAKGDITSDQVAELTANQANAAFGELNYVTMGRSPQTQAILRMMFLAPDFLEARGRFASQALRPYGREQYAALFRGALGMYGVARILNQLLDDDPHWDKPFSLVVHGYEYQIRSLPGDIYHLLEDPNSFIMHRLNPLLVKQGWEFISGKDDFGRKRNAGEQIMDAVRSVTPIPGQGMFKHTPGGLLSGLLSSAGVTRSKYRTKAGALAHQYAIGDNPNDVTSHHITEMVDDIEHGNLDGQKVGQLLLDGKMNPRDLTTAMKLASMPELYRDYYRLPVELKAKVFAAATPSEKALLISLAKREPDTSRLLPEQRAQFMRDFAKQ